MSKINVELDESLKPGEFYFKYGHDAENLFSNWYGKHGKPSMFLGKIFYGGVAERDKQNEETILEIIRLIKIKCGWKLEDLLPAIEEMLPKKNYPFDNYNNEPSYSYLTDDNQDVDDLGSAIAGDYLASMKGPNNE